MKAQQRTHPLAISAKFGEHGQSRKPEEDMGIRHRPLLPSWLPYIFLMTVPLMIGMVLVHRKYHEVSLSCRDTKFRPELAAQRYLLIDDDEALRRNLEDGDTDARSEEHADGLNDDGLNDASLE